MVAGLHSTRGYRGRQPRAPLLGYPGPEDPMERDGQQPSDGAVLAATELDEGGDPVCWAHLVCPACGLLNATRHRRRCEGCGASFDPDEDW
jgi:hypothetical protein